MVAGIAINLPKLLADRSFACFDTVTNFPECGSPSDDLARVHRALRNEIACRRALEIACRRVLVIGDGEHLDAVRIESNSNAAAV